MPAETRSFPEKALLIALDTLGAVALLITIGAVVILVGSIGALLGFMYANQHDLSDSVRYGVEAICALLAPVWFCAWLWRLWQRVVRSDDDKSQTS
jgi:hypothetical protein